MAEYINRELADLLLKQRAEVYEKVGANYALTIIQGDRAVIHTIAKADVRENVRGEWSISRTDIGWNGNEYPTHCKCSKCGIEIPYNETKNYCPRCGADMRGESDERLY